MTADLMAPRRVRIVSEGTTGTTRVLDAKGDPIPGITHIEILPIDAARPEPVQAIITLQVEIDMDALFGDFHIEAET